MDRQSTLVAAGTGTVAGVGASIIQAAIGWLISRYVLPEGHDNHIAPRFINRLRLFAAKPPNPVVEWLLGTAFHLGYGAGWGALFGVTRRWTRAPESMLAPVFAGLIYLTAVFAWPWPRDESSRCERWPSRLRRPAAPRPSSRQT